MYIFESLLQFGSILLPLCISGIILLISTIDIIRRTHRSRLPGILFLLPYSCLFIVLLSFSMSIVILPANATIQQLLPYYQWCGVFFGVFFLTDAFYITFLTKWDILNGIQLAHILTAIFAIPFLYLIIMVGSDSSVSLVSDGILNYLALPIPVVLYGTTLCIILMILSTYKIFWSEGGKREKREQFWLRLYWFFSQISLVILILAILVEFTAAYMPLLFVTYPIVMIIGISIMLKYETIYGQRKDAESKISSIEE
jgi:hypothetical protein